MQTDFVVLSFIVAQLIQELIQKAEHWYTWKKKKISVLHNALHYTDQQKTIAETEASH